MCRIDELIEIDILKVLFLKFFDTTRIPIVLLDSKGKDIINIEWQDLCQKVGKKGIKDSDKEEFFISLKPETGEVEYKIYKNNCGLYETIFPIIVDNEELGNLKIGKFYLEKSDKWKFSEELKKYGFGEDFIEEEYKKIAVLSNFEAETSRNSVKVFDFCKNLSNAIKNDCRRSKIHKEHRIESDTISKSFLTLINHEVRTPLSGILSVAELSLMVNDSEKHKEFLKLIYDSSVKLNCTINEILEYTKLQWGETIIKETKVNIRQFFSGIIKNYVDRNDNMVYEININKTVPEYMMIDKNKMEIIINNLLDNAVKFSTNGKVNLCVSLGHDSVSNKKELLISVKDNGCGIPEDKRSHIFEPFFQGEDCLTRQHSGIGLGLAIVKKLVEKLGGIVTYQPNSEGGSTFLLKIKINNSENA